MSIRRNVFILCLFVGFSLFVMSTVSFAQDEPIGLYTHDDRANSGGVAFNCYPSGYSDGWYWGWTDRHQEYSHETLSGEWAAAIYYTGILNNKAQWLVYPKFIYPDWDTYTSFREDTNFYYNQDTQQWKSWHVWNNNRTAQSRVSDPNIQVTIDYSIIDLGADVNAAIPFYPQGYSGTNIPYVASDRYILIQTCNIKNTSSVNITGLKLYQMLNSLVTLSGTRSSTYSYKKFPGLLEGYDPQNPSGVFKYAITQWNNYEEHMDWVSFASTVAPAWFENGIYDTGYGGDSTPGYITYDIKNCNLNGDPNIYGSDGAAGAMGWDLGTLEPNQTKSITLAVMFGCGTIQYASPYDVDLSITDDVSDCIYPNNDVNFTVSYAANQDINDVNLVVELSPYLTFNYCTGSGVYNPSNRTVTWSLGDRTIGEFNDLPVADYNSYTINCTVNSNAPEGWYMQSTAKLYAGQDLAEDAITVFEV